MLDDDYAAAAARRTRAYEAIHSGVPLRDIAAQLGVTHASVTQMLAQHEAELAQHTGQIKAALSERTYRALLGQCAYEGVPLTVEWLRAAAEAGRLREVPMIGAVSLREIAALLTRSGPGDGQAIDPQADE